MLVYPIFLDEVVSQALCGRAAQTVACDSDMRLVIAGNGAQHLIEAVVFRYTVDCTIDEVFIIKNTIDVFLGNVRKPRVYAVLVHFRSCIRINPVCPSFLAAFKGDGHDQFSVGCVGYLNKAVREAGFFRYPQTADVHGLTTVLAVFSTGNSQLKTAIDGI